MGTTAIAAQGRDHDLPRLPAPTGLDNPKAPSNCTAIIGCARFMIDGAIADFEDVNVGRPNGARSRARMACQQRSVASARALASTGLKVASASTS